MNKVCPVVYRRMGNALDLLAFRHPLAGLQFVKGTVEPGEPAARAAMRELREESGLCPSTIPRHLGTRAIGDPPMPWHFYAVRIEGLPRTWDHRTADDGGHVFSFFWHPLAVDLDAQWHPMFHEALWAIRLWLPFPVEA